METKLAKGIKLYQSGEAPALYVKYVKDESKWLSQTERVMLNVMYLNNDGIINSVGYRVKPIRRTKLKQA